VNLLRIFYAPERVFSELPDKGGGWVVPFVAALLVAVLSTAVIVNMIGIESIIKTQLESNPRLTAQMDQKKIDEVARTAADSTLRKMLTYLSPPIASAFVLCVMALALLGIMQLVDAPAPLTRVLAVCSYTQFAYHAVTLVMGVIILSLLTDRSGIDLNDLVRLNPTLFLERTTTPKFLYSALSSVDLLTFWAIFLTALGLTKSASKLKMGKALAIVIAPWALWVVARSSLAALF
jgi:hypothetical protein